MSDQQGQRSSAGEERDEAAATQRSGRRKAAPVNVVIPINAGVAATVLAGGASFTDEPSE